MTFDQWWGTFVSASPDYLDNEDKALAQSAWNAGQQEMAKVTPKSKATYPYTLNEVFIPAGYYTIRDLEQILTNQKKWKEEHETQTAKK